MAIFVVIETSTPAFAEEGSLPRVLPYFFITIFVGIVIAILLSSLAQAKSYFGEKTGTTSSLLQSSPGVMQVIRKLSASGPGGRERAEEVVRVFSQELDKKLSIATQELEQKYSKIIDDKDNKIKLINREYSHVKEGYEQVSAEKKHTESLVRSIADGLVIVNEQGEVELVNAAAQKLLGVENEEEIVGKPFLDKIKDEQLVSMLKGSSRDKERDIEFKSKSNDTKKVIRASSAVIEDEKGKTIGMVSVLSDITARKRAEEVLRSSEERLRKIIETNADGMIVVDQKGIVRFVNQATVNLFGRNEEQLLGKPCGFPVEADKKTELNIDAKDGKSCIAEMHAVEIEWERQHAFLVSLRDVTETVRMREELKRLSLSDVLTGLYNRRGFVTLAEQQLKIARDMAKNPILLFIDLDNMKWINDALGHPEGDRALVEVSGILRKTFRESDIIGRIGGDEFAVLAIEPAEKSTGLLASLQKNVEARNVTGNWRHNLSVSVGVVHYDPKHPCVIEELLARADKSMYEEKRAKQKARRIGKDL